MQSLFDIPSRDLSPARDKKLLKKVTATAEIYSSIKINSDNLMTKVVSVISTVRTKLAMYASRYRLITTEEDLKKYIDQSIIDGELAIDTETSGLDVFTCIIAGVCLKSTNQQAVYIPINHLSYITYEKLPNQLSSEYVAEQLNRVKDLKLIYHNYTFDKRILKHKLGIDLPCYWDCYVASRLLNENEEDNSLKYLYNKYCKKGEDEVLKFESLFRGVPFNLIPPTTAICYGAKDPDITFELFKFQEPYLTIDNPLCKGRKLERVASLFREVEIPLLSIVSDMMDKGVGVSIEKTQALKVSFEAKLDALMKDYIRESEPYREAIQRYNNNPKNTTHLDYPINPNSGNQMAVLIYDIMKLNPVIKKKAKGASKTTRPTGKDILKQFDIPLFGVIKEIKEIKKVISTYIEPALERYEKTGDNRVHCNWRTLKTKTGRFSSNSPNFQNVPAKLIEIRQQYVPEQGYVFISADYSQQEMMALASLADDELMLQSFNEGKDIYSHIASIAFHKPYEDCLEKNPDGSTNKKGKALRQRAKQVALGIVYGMGVKAISESLNIPTTEAKEIKDAVLVAFPKVAKFIDDTAEFCKKNEYVETFYGRRRRLPDINLPDYEVKYKEDDEPSRKYAQRIVNQLKHTYKRETKEKLIKEASKYGVYIFDNTGKVSEATRQMCNSRIQGSASDLTKRAMLLLHKELHKIGAVIVMQIHDEIIIECPIEHAQEGARILQDCMVRAGSDLKAKLRCDVEVSDCWQGKAIEFEWEDLEEDDDDENED